MSLPMIDVIACFLEAFFCVFASAVVIGILAVCYTFIAYIKHRPRGMSFPSYFEKIWQ